jgi:hypothetical protein
MKFRNGFVSNSSSTNFYVKNISNKTLTLVDFIAENPQFIEFANKRKVTGYPQYYLLASAFVHNIIFEPNIEVCCEFQNFHGGKRNIVGETFYYIIKTAADQTGQSDHFKWEIKNER